MNRPGATRSRSHNRDLLERKFGAHDRQAPPAGSDGRIELHKDHAVLIRPGKPNVRVQGSPEDAIAHFETGLQPQPARCVYLKNIPLGGVTHVRIAEAYADWIIGSGAFTALRSARIQAGVLRQATPELLLESGRAQHWMAEAEARVRITEGMTLVHFRHRDIRQPAVFWENQVMVVPEGTGVRLSHAVMKSAPYESPAQLSMEPVIVTALLKEFPVPPGTWVAANSPPNIVNAGVVRQVIDGVLHSESPASCPLLVLGAPDGEPLADRSRLASGLKGFARVIELSDAKANAAWNQAMTAELKLEQPHDLGSAQLYLPGARGAYAVSIGHYWTRPTDLDGRCQALVHETRRAYAQMLSRYTSGVDMELLRHRKRDLEAALVNVSHAQGQAVDWQKLAESLLRDLEASQARESSLEVALQEETQRRVGAERGALRKRNAESRLGPDDAKLLLDIFKRSLDKNEGAHAVLEALRVLQLAYPDRLAFHPQAERALRKGGSHLRPFKKWVEEMETLATRWYDAYPNTHGVFPLRQCAEWEGEATLSRYPEGRIVDWNGQRIVGGHHLRTNNGRTQFGIGKKDGKLILVVTHAGEHLPTA